MTRMGVLIGRWMTGIKEKRMFWRILLLYLAGSVVLLGVFSAVLTAALTKRAGADAVARNRDALNQAYAAAGYVLNTTYDTYYKLYESEPASRQMFTVQTSETASLEVGRLLSDCRIESDCVASVYLVNRLADKVYTSEGEISTLDTFQDEQAMRLFKFYNEKSNTLFLPRAVTLRQGTKTEEHRYISMIFSRRSGYLIPMGGLIVNIDEEKLIALLASKLESPESIYIVSENGSILANQKAEFINSSLYGEPIWAEVQNRAGQESFSFTIEHEGRRCLVTGISAPRLRFYFLCITPMAELEKGVDYIRAVALLCSAVFLALAFGMSMAASRFIYTPISRLVQRLRLCPAPGGAEASPAQDEMGFLGSAYGALCEEVEALSHDNLQLARASRREVVLRLLRGEYPTEDKCCAEAARLEKFPAEGGYLALALLLDDFSTLSKTMSVQDLALCRYALGNVASELLAECGTPYCADAAPDQVAVLLALPAPGDALPPALPALLARVSEAMRTYLKCTVTCGVGTPSPCLTELVTGYNRAMTATGYRLVRGRGVVICYEEIARRQSISPEYPLEADAALVQALRSRNEEKAGAGLEDFFSALALANVDSIHMAVTQLAISLNRTVHSMAAGREGTRQLPNYRVLSEQLAGCDTLDACKEILRSYCTRVIRLRNEEVQSKKEGTVEQIKGFIAANYGNPMLNTEDIAAFAELSPNYLRTIFKNAVGCSPTDYLTDYRMERACELLATTENSTKEIAAAVGYYNHRYFYSVFKAKNGMTATAYRAAQRGGAAPEKEGDEE